jgi:hypothetical protein
MRHCMQVGAPWTSKEIRDGFIRISKDGQAVIPLTMAQYSTSTFPWEGSRTGFDLHITRTIVGAIRQVAEITVALLCIIRVEGDRGLLQRRFPMSDLFSLGATDAR